MGNLIAAVLVPAVALVVLGTVDSRLALVLLPALVVVAAAPFALRRLADRQGAQLKEQLATLQSCRWCAGPARAGRLRPRPVLRRAAGLSRGRSRSPPTHRRPRRGLRRVGTGSARMRWLG
ncbi:MAG: hypothetical protein ACRDSF_08595 [Pseudonocardiaceae bacterium]